MPVERSAGVIIFTGTRGGRKYLLLHSSREKDFTRPDFWDFTKEVLEAGESGRDAAKRAAREEAGLEDISIFRDFKETVRYFTRRHGKPVPKFVAMFLAEAGKDKVMLSWEHDRYDWLSYEEARERISNPQMKRALERAESFLRRSRRVK